MNEAETMQRIARFNDEVAIIANRMKLSKTETIYFFTVGLATAMNKWNLEPTPLFDKISSIVLNMRG